MGWCSSWWKDRRSRIGSGKPSPRGRGLPLDEALTIARQIAEALDAAHEKGIVHRDLKPANIKLTPEGTVKVLDFGLAKVAAGQTPGSASSPTVGRGETREGTILGTAAYMSPEQARGKPVDKRMDIWAFGCVLYEMLAGRPAFTAKRWPTRSPRSSSASRTGARCRTRRRAVCVACCGAVSRRIRDSGCATLATRRPTSRAIGTQRSSQGAPPCLHRGPARRASRWRHCRSPPSSPPPSRSGSRLRPRPSSDARPTPARFSVPPPPGRRVPGRRGRARGPLGRVRGRLRQHVPRILAGRVAARVRRRGRWWRPSHLAPADLGHRCTSPVGHRGRRLDCSGRPTVAPSPSSRAAS